MQWSFPLCSEGRGFSTAQMLNFPSFHSVLPALGLVNGYVKIQKKKSLFLQFICTAFPPLPSLVETQVGMSINSSPRPWRQLKSHMRLLPLRGVSWSLDTSLSAVIQSLLQSTCQGKRDKKILIFLPSCRPLYLFAYNDSLVFLPCPAISPPAVVLLPGLTIASLLSALLLSAFRTPLRIARLFRAVFSFSSFIHFPACVRATSVSPPSSLKRACILRLKALWGPKC